MGLSIRQYKEQDCATIIKLFKETVHTINAKDYTAEQLSAWAPVDIDSNLWQQTLSENYTVVVENGDVIAGFGDMDSNGYFNRLFVHKDYQGMGIASLIAEALEQFAKDKKLSVITVEVSITAKPFFINRGYAIIKPQSVERNGQVFVNFLMNKNL